MHSEQEESTKFANKRGQIPAIRFNLDGLPPSQRIEAWHTACTGFFDVTIDEGSSVDPGAYFAWHRVDDLMFSSGVSPRHRATRRSFHISQQKQYVRILFSRQGGSSMIIDGRVTELNGDSIHLIDYSRPFVHLRNRIIDLDGVYVPHEAIGYDTARHPACLSVYADSPAGRMLIATYLAMKSQLSVIDTSQAAMLAAGFNGLLRALFLPQDKDERGLAAVRAARHQAMCAYIERNLRDPSLGIADLCRIFAASRPTIYRDFEAHGGVASFIMGRRLERAFIDLADHPPIRGAVSSVARSWGFDSMSHFNRRFRARFGIAPSEVVPSAPKDTIQFTAEGVNAPPPPSDPAHPGTLSHWFASR